MAGDAGFYFKTNPLTLETTQTKHWHLNYSPVFSLLGHLLYTSSPRFSRASKSWSQGPSHCPTLLEGQGCQQRLSVTRTLALLIILPRMRMGTLTSLRRKLRGQRFVKCDPVHRRRAPLQESWAPHHTTFDDLRPIGSRHWEEAWGPGMMALTRSTTLVQHLFILVFLPLSS